MVPVGSRKKKDGELNHINPYATHVPHNTVQSQDCQQHILFSKTSIVDMIFPKRYAIRKWTLRQQKKSLAGLLISLCHFRGKKFWACAQKKMWDPATHDGFPALETESSKMQFLCTPEN